MCSESVRNCKMSKDAFISRITALQLYATSEVPVSIHVCQDSYNICSDS